MKVENISVIDPHGRVHFVFEDNDIYSHYKNIKQSWCFCLNKNNQVLLVRWTAGWALPGGTIEKGETPEECLHREVLEEADITLKNVQLLGVQTVKYLDDSAKADESQLRFIARIDELKEQTIDPHHGFMSERKFFAIDELPTLLPWGPTIEHLCERIKDWCVRN